MKKKCPKCGRVLSLVEFNWKVKNIKRQVHCRDCARKYIRSHYLKHTQYYLDKASKRNKQIRERAYVFLGPYLLTHCCVDCGEKDILVLEFDHKDRRVKLGEISHIIQNGATLREIEA